MTRLSFRQIRVVRRSFCEKRRIVNAIWDKMADETGKYFHISIK